MSKGSIDCWRSASDRCGDKPAEGRLRILQHKKREVELHQELLVEAQCWSNRPAFCLRDVDSEAELFHLYNAMGLPHGHENVSTLLAQIRNSAALGRLFGTGDPLLL